MLCLCFVQFVMFATPLLVYAAPIVPCGYDAAEMRAANQDAASLGKPIPYPTDKITALAEPCQFNHFIIGINNVINFLIMIGGSVAAIVFAIAGFMILTAGANESQVTRAKGMFWSVLKGFALMLAAWLLVKMVLVGLGVTDAFSFLG